MFPRIFFQVVFSIGFIAVTNHLKAAVAVRVAATEITAVVPAVINISLSGTGTLTLIIGISTCFIPAVGLVAVPCLDSALIFDLTPAGALKSLGGTTKGVYCGIFPKGNSNSKLGKS